MSPEGKLGCPRHDRTPLLALETAATARPFASPQGDRTIGPLGRIRRYKSRDRIGSEGEKAKGREEPRPSVASDIVIRLFFNISGADLRGQYK
jgi:hypothetical protein